MTYLVECESCNEDLKIQHLHWEEIVCVECGDIVKNNLPEMYRDYINLQYKDGIWYYIGGSAGRQTLESHIRKNKNRMYVGGKYVPVSNPTHTPGRFKNYNDVVFKEYYKSKDIKEGNVYLISNPAWAGWLKVGRAMSVPDRLNAFQTGSPHRDYKVEYAIAVEDAPQIEKLLHNELKNKYRSKCEWFKLEVSDALNLLNEVIDNAENN